MLARHSLPLVAEALADTPAVMLVGARQTGKTTLARAIAAERERAVYVTLDDATALEAATADPGGFLAGLDGLVVIDEIQRAPELLPALKSAVDRRRASGRFLLTGSADVLALPRVSESLAGRMEVVTLWPLSRGEIAGTRETWLDRVLRGDPPPRAREADVIADLLRGGYPEALARERPERRRAFFDAYVTTLVARDVRDISAIEDPGALRRLLQLVSARTSSVLNHAELSRTLGLPVSTLKRHLAVLELLFLVRQLPAWSSNRGKRLARAPKLHVVDTGLAAAVTALDRASLERDRVTLGGLLESFVVGEVAKQASWLSPRPELLHLRTHAGREVDLVIESPGGRVVGIEVKAASTVTDQDFAGLRALQELAGKAFVAGVVLHLGDASVPFGPRLSAQPVAALWGR